jgi:hypothetical protein
MQITEQQKKWAWIVGAVLLVVHFLPNIIGAVHSLISPPVVSAVRAKTSPVRAAPAQPTSPVPRVPESPFVKLVGTWAGNSVNERGRCETRLFLKLKDEAPGEYTGYPTRVCGPFSAFMGSRLNIGRAREGVLDQMTQVSSIMSGTLESDALKLKMSQLVVSSPDRCDLSAMTIRPFGNDQLAVAWEEGGICKGGQMLMGRVR